MRTLLSLILLSFLLGACSNIIEVDATIVEQITESTLCGQGIVIIQLENGLRDKRCGYWGKPGTKIKGYWVQGSWHIFQKENGFHFTK